MLLCVPGGSFDWLSHTSYDTVSGHHAGTDQPTEADLGQALAAMAAGEVEYVILDAETGSFVQAAGTGQVGYVLERWDHGAATSSRHDATLDDVRAAMLAFLTGTAGPPPPAPPPPARRRWFGRD